MEVQNIFFFTRAARVLVDLLDPGPICLLSHHVRHFKFFQMELLAIVSPRVIGGIGGL